MHRKVIIVSAVIGFTVGSIVAGGFILASVIFCMGLRACPVSWVPYVILFFAGAAGAAVVFTTIGWSLYAIYLRYYKNGL